MTALFSVSEKTTSRPLAWNGFGLYNIHINFGLMRCYFNEKDLGDEKKDACVHCDTDFLAGCFFDLGRLCDF